MSKARKAITAGLFLALLIGLAPGGSPPVGPQDLPPAVLKVPPAVLERIEEAQAGDEMVTLQMMAESPADLPALADAVTASGGKVLQREESILLAELPASTAEQVAQEAHVAALGTNATVSLDDVQTVALQEHLALQDAIRQVGVSMDAMGTAAFRSSYGVAGNGVVVAVIDTGVDPGHPALQTTPGGQFKLIDWKDFTAEGFVNASQVVGWSQTTMVASDGRSYQLPARPPASQYARFGYWDEFSVMGLINRDLDRNGSQMDRFGVLVVDSTVTGTYDMVYVDSNNDGSFADEEPLRLFRESHTVGRLGRFRSGPYAEGRLNFVVAELDPAGKTVKLGFDGMGHGTNVAGVLAGSSSVGFSGVAPGVQLMVLKALNSAGTGDWFTIRQAIRYAAEHGASIINISVGKLAAAASRFDSTASEWLNQIARDYGVLIVLAADNTGPGLSSGTTLGNPSEVMAVGAYYSPEMWKRDFGYVVPHESIWALSGMGPRSDGSYLPNVVAPGGSPTTAPSWIEPTGYTTKVGTSIATPHVSGAAALLIEAGRKIGANTDRLSVKRALELGARPIAGFGVYEQGYGLVSLPVALTNLRRINSVPALKARSDSGNGGFLARSYVPGNTAFWLSNLDTAVTRVGIYSSADWVRPAFSSLTIGPDQPRRLPLEILPPAAPGVHSAFLTVTHHDKYGPSLTVPITYVRPVELTPLDRGYRAAETLEAGRYQRHFLQVTPGMSALQVVARVPFDAQGTPQGSVQVHLFRPDGRVVYSGTVGVQGQSMTARVSVDAPVEGVWEVVVNALPDAEGSHLSAGYTLEAQVRPEAVAGQPLRLNLDSGAHISQPLQLTNPGAGFTGQLVAFGLSPLTPGDPWNTGVPWRVEQQQQMLVEDFTLPKSVARMQVEVNNVLPATDDMKLQLYYLDGSRGWQLRGQATLDSAGRAVIEVANLPTGRYQTLVTVNGVSPFSTQFQYRRLVAVEGYQLIAEDPVRFHEQGQTWSTNLDIRAPYAPGRYVGHLLLRDTDNKRTLAWVPIELSVGQPALSVQPMVAELVRGKSSTVTLEIREAATGKLVDAAITVNGRRYTSKAGKVLVPVTPSGDRMTLAVEANVPDYQFVKTELVLPVRDKWGSHPLGVDPPEQWPAWHRKLINLLP